MLCERNKGETAEEFRKGIKETLGGEKEGGQRSVHLAGLHCPQSSIQKWIITTIISSQRRNHYVDKTKPNINSIDKNFKASEENC